MAVRRRGALLAGLGILLALCAGAGCHSVPAKPENQTAKPAADGPTRSWYVPRHYNPNATPGQTAKKPAPANPEPAEEPGTPAKESPVAMLRPVAARGVSDAPAETGSTESWRTTPQESEGAGRRAAPTAQGPPDSQSNEYPPVVNTSAQEQVPTGPDTSSALTPIPADGPWDSQASPPAAFSAEMPGERTPESKVQLIPVRPEPTEKPVTTAGFVESPSPFSPPLAGVAVPKEFAKQAYASYVIEPPDILLINATPAIGLKTQPLAGPHQVRPDGTVGLGIYGSVFVAGMTIDQARAAIASVLKQRAAKDLTEEQIQLELQVDVSSYNSKFYYIIAEGGGQGQQVYRVLCTGNETVLDAISQTCGLRPFPSNMSIWVARATPGDAKNARVLPVDWKAITQLGSAATNYQLFPGDRLFLYSDQPLHSSVETGSGPKLQLAPTRGAGCCLETVE